MILVVKCIIKVEFSDLMFFDITHQKRLFLLKFSAGNYIEQKNLGKKLNNWQKNRLKRIGYLKLHLIYYVIRLLHTKYMQ